jgi:geranylgeranylglycerol-phosphate geranylgeranyltransferase
MAMGKLGAYVRLMRPVNCLMMGFAVVVGVTLANSSDLGIFSFNLVYGFLTGFLLTAASMTINDYYDREIDVINEPNRPIPSGIIKPKQVLVFASGLTLVGFVAAYVTNLLCLALAIIAWTVFVAYSTFGKRSGLLGNFFVSTCVSIPFIYGSAAIAGAVELNVLLFASMAFLSNTGREITKGIVDVKGDESRKVKTLAVRYGEKKAAVSASILYVAAVLLSPIPLLLSLVSFWFIPFVVVTDFGLVVSSFSLLRDFSRENARKVKNHVLVWFIFGLVAFIVGSLG